MTNPAPLTRVRRPRVVAPPEPALSDAEIHARLDQMGKAFTELAQLLGRMPVAERDARARSYKDKLKSRKFLLTVAVGALAAGADALGWHLETDTILLLLGGLIAFITGDVVQDGIEATTRKPQ